MTKLPTKTRNRNAISNENSNIKSNIKKPIQKQKATRQVLLDRTNSVSDHNSSSTSPEITIVQNKIESTSRPKRVNKLPSRFQDHELSPISRKKGGPKSSSTPLQLDNNRQSKIICQLSPIVEINTKDFVKNVAETNKNIKIIHNNKHISKTKNATSPDILKRNIRNRKRNLESELSVNDTVSKEKEKSPIKKNSVRNPVNGTKSKEKISKTNAKHSIKELTTEGKKSTNKNISEKSTKATRQKKTNVENESSQSDVVIVESNSKSLKKNVQICDAVEDSQTKIQKDASNSPNLTEKASAGLKRVTRHGKSDLEKKSQVDSTFKQPKSILKKNAPNKKKTINNNSTSPKSSPNTPPPADAAVSTFDKNENTKKNVPIYKRNLISDKNVEVDKETLYDFYANYNTKPPIMKKKRVKNQNPVKRKKMLSRKSAEAAMKMFLEDIKKIREENMMKKLAAKVRNKKNNENAPNIFLKVNNINRFKTSPNNPPPSLLDDYHDNEPMFNDDHDNEPVFVEDHNNEPVLNNVLETSTRLTVHSSNETFNSPIANSTLISKSDKPSGSPWRVDLDTDVKKWRYNFYVKPSMTPAYERDTFHVIGLDDKNDSQNVKNVCAIIPSPRVSSMSEKNVAKLKQTSILSFYEESLRKSPMKRKNASIKNTNKEYNFSEYETTPPEVLSNDSEESPTKTTQKQTRELVLDNCFGFDENSMEFDQENVSPKKNRQKSIAKSVDILCKRRKTNNSVLKDINKAKNGPFRLDKELLLEVINNNIDHSFIKKLQPTEEIFVAVQNNEDSNSSNSENVNTTTQQQNVENEVALFEDALSPEVIHNTKPPRHSYERRRRLPVRFQNVGELTEDESDNTSDEEQNKELNYIISKKTFKKRKTKKNAPKQLSKKEEKEADEWAAEFNSMLEEAEEFTLCVDKSGNED